MANLQSVSFTTPGSEYAADQSDILRRQKLAEMLQQQSAQPLDPNRMAGGWVIPISPFEGMAKIAQGLSSGMVAKKAEEKQRALAEKIQGDYRTSLATALQKLQGTPGSPGSVQDTTQEGTGSMDMSGTQGPANTAAVPAQAPDPIGALAAAGSNPMAAQLVGPLASQQIEQQQRQRMLASILQNGGPQSAAPQGAPTPMQQGSAPPQPPQMGIGTPSTPQPPISAAQAMQLIASGDSSLAAMGQAALKQYSIPLSEQAKIDQSERHFKGVSGSAALADERARREGALNRGAHFTIAGMDTSGRPLNAGGAEPVDLSKVSPVDLEAAHRYNADGTLPPNMGRGQQGMMESRRIRGIAAQLSQAAGIDPSDVRANQLAFKSNGAALTQLAKRESQIGANVRNFDFNSHQVLDLSQKVDRTGVPVVNSWINAGRRAVTGNPELSAFDVAVKTTVNEFAQIVSGTTAGATTEGEKQKAEKLLAAAQTPQQIMSVINQMRIESQNRMKSFADQKQQTLASMKSGQPVSTPTPAAPPASSAKSDIQREADKILGIR